MQVLRFVSRCALVVASLCATATAAQAQAWPQRPIRLVVPVSPGGPTDIVARALSQKLAEGLGQPVVVDNKPGGGTNIGVSAVAKAPADGYTLLLGTTTQAINATLYRTLPYDLLRDFVPVSRLAMGPLVLVVNPALPVESVADLVALSKKKPLSFASSNVGASTHLAGEMFKSRAQLNAVHVPYKGSGPALTDTMGGQVDFMFDTMLSAMPFVSNGKLKALAVTSRQRAAAAPKLPTMIESGFAEFEAASWYGLLAPAGTPPEVVQRLEAEVARVLADRDVQDKFAAQGFAAAGLAGGAFQGFIKAEIAKWGAIVKASNASPE